MKRIFSCSTSQVAIEKWNKHDQKLFEAVEKRDLEKMVALLSKKPVRASKPNPKGQSAFHLAAAKGLTECLNTLLSHGVEINAKNDEGCTALHLAASGCHPDCVKLLLQRGANEESIDFHSRTALHCAASSGCVSSVLLLCDQDEISLDAGDDDGWTPLMIAAQKNHPTICSLLLERGALVNILDKEKKTALILASEKGNIQAAETLLAHSADVTATDCLGHDALYCADLSRDEALRCLLQGALDKRKKGNETDQRLSRSQESVDAHEESQAPSVPNNIGHDHLALQQDEWRRRYEEEQKKVSRLQGELLKKTHDHEIFAERSRTERDRIQARVHEISSLLTGMTSEQAGRRSGEMRPLSRSLEQPYFLDLLAGQVQAMKEKHQETEKEKQLLQEETVNMARREAAAEELQQLQEKHQEEVEQLQSQVTTAMEEKTSAMRRVTEMEGHLDNMRAVLSQFENRKRIQSSMMEDLNESVFEMTSENERLRQLVRTLEERAEKEEKTETQERALANKCKNAQNVLDSTIRELRQLLRQVRTECASVQKDKAILAESQTLRRNLGDPMQSKLQPGLEPTQALEKCGVSWRKTVMSLELMLTNLEKSNHGLLEKSTQLQRAIAPLQHEGFQAEVEPKVYVNGMASTHQGEYELQKETSNTYPEQFNEAEEPQSKFPKEEKLFHEPVLCCQGDKLQQNKGSAYSNQLVDSTGRHQDFILSNDCVAMQEALSRAVELQKEVSDLTLENAGLLKELNDAGEEKEKLQGELHTLRRSLQTDFVPMEYVKSQLGELEQNVVLLTDELSTEQEKTRKLVSQLELQRSEIHQLMDSFPPEIVQEEKSKDGKTFSMDVLEELFWNVGTLVRKHNEILQQKLKLGQENEELKHEQTLCISITDHNQKLTSMSHKIDEQATEIEELEQKLSNAKNAVEDLIAVTHKIDSQAAEILELEQKLSNAIDVAEDLTSMTHKIGSQATEILELEEKLSNANKAIEDLTSMTHNIDSQATEIQELQEKLSNTNKAIEDLSSMTHKIDSQATEILELEEKLSNANKAIEDLASMTHKIDSQATEILELEEKLSNANKAIEDLASMTHKIDSQATEIQELQEKLSNANKVIEDIPSMTHRIDSHATEIQELEHKLSNAISAVDGLTLMAHRLDEQAIEIQALEHKLCNATKAVEDFTSMTHKVERQTTEIQELEQKLSSAIKAVEDLSSVTHTIEVQATEIQELKHKLSSATKAAEDFTSMTHKIEKQTTEIQELEQKLSNATKTVEDLQKELLVQKTNSVSKDEHSQLISALEKRLTEANVKLESEKQRLGDKCQEITVLTQQLNQASVQIEELKTREERCLQDHEKVRSTLEFQIQTLKGELKAMLDKSELAHREASSWERKAMTRIQTNKDQSSKTIGLEEEAAERLVKSETSQNAVGHLLEKVSQVPSVCQDKERKIAELLAELERYSEEVEDLRSKHEHVQVQLKDTQKQHQEIVATYRTHLLHAAQGFMDEEVHLSLVRIRKMQDSMIS